MPKIGENYTCKLDHPLYHVDTRLRATIPRKAMGHRGVREEGSHLRKSEVVQEVGHDGQGEGRDAVICGSYYVCLELSDEVAPLGR